MRSLNIMEKPLPLNSTTPQGGFPAKFPDIVPAFTMQIEHW